MAEWPPQQQQTCGAFFYRVSVHRYVRTTPYVDGKRKRLGSGGLDASISLQNAIRPPSRTQDNTANEMEEGRYWP
jgi:hypothetical protein